MKCQELVKTSNYPEAKFTSSNVLFYPTSSPQQKHHQFTVTCCKSKHQMLTCEKLELNDFIHFQNSC